MRGWYVTWLAAFACALAGPCLAASTISLTGQVVAVDADLGLLHVQPDEVLTSDGQPRTDLEAIRATFFLGDPGLAAVADGQGGLVPIEAVRPGWVVQAELTPPAADQPLGTVASLVVSAPPDAPRLPALGFLYGDGTPQPECAALSLTFPIPGGRAWSDNYLAAYSTGPHNGLDIPAPKLTPLLAPFDGLVVLRRTPSSVGGPYTVVFRAADGQSVLYTHLNDDGPGTTSGLGGEQYAFAPFLRLGARVAAGELVGWVGDSGRATGPHLHLETRLPDGRVVSPVEAIAAATVVSEPRVVPRAVGLRRPAGLRRYDGALAAVEPATGRIALDLRSTTERDGTTVGARAPQRLWFGGARDGLALLGAAEVRLPLAELPLGAFVVVFGQAGDGADGRLEQGYIAAPGVRFSAPPRVSRAPLGPAAR